MSQKEEKKQKEEEDELETLIKFANDKDDTRLISDIMNRESSHTVQQVPPVPEETITNKNKNKSKLIRKAGTSKDRTSSSPDARLWGP